ncbi:MAG: hypothetical protein N2169_01965 [bacterium]|nr:hypothetical protein [bacterium]
MWHMNDFIDLFSKIEKLYFLNLDEQNNYDFLNLLINLQEKTKNDTQIYEFLERKIIEKQKIIMKIKKIKNQVENELKILKMKNLCISPALPLFLTFFLQTNMNKISNNGNKRIERTQ